MTCRFGYFSLIYLIMLIWKIELPWDESWRYSRKTLHCYLQSIINLKLYISQLVDNLNESESEVKCSESRSQRNLHTTKYDPTFERLRFSSHMDLFLKRSLINTLSGSQLNSVQTLLGSFWYLGSCAPVKRSECAHHCYHTKYVNPVHPLQICERALFSASSSSTDSSVIKLKPLITSLSICLGRKAALRNLQQASLNPVP